MSVAIIKRWILGIIICMNVFLGMSSLAAVHNTSKFRIEPGSYAFGSLYRLHIPTSATDLIVQMEMQRYVRIIRAINGPIIPSALCIHLKFNVDDTPTAAKINLYSNGQYKITEIGIDSSSEWYPALKKLVEMLCKKYIVVQDYKIKGGYVAKDNTVSIRPLKGCQLITTDAVRIMSLKSRRSSFARRTLVKVAITLTTNNNGKELLTAVASFCTKEGATKADPYSRIKFVKTKKGLKEISRKHIGRSSVWYPGVKKIVEKSVRKYRCFKRAHEKIS